MKVGSLFAGIGGFDLGFEQAGFTTSWQVEIDKYCLQVLERHFPTARRYADVRECGKHNLESVDVLCGGFPCQDLSVAGRREGLGGERSGLWWEFRRLISELAPRWVIIENVPGLLSSNEWRDMGTVLWSLGALGYGYAYRVLDAQWHGLAQRRKRVFIVGCLGDWTSAAKVLLEPESSIRDTAPSREKGQGIADTFATSPDGSGEESDISPTLDTRSADGPRRNQGGVMVCGPLSASGAGTARTGNERNEAEMLVAATLRSGGAGGVPSSRSEHLVVNTLRAFGYEQEQSLTQQKQMVLANAVRRLTPTECERLQGFPDGWTLLGDKTADAPRYKALGNAVAVPVARWIARRIKEVSKWTT